MKPKIKICGITNIEDALLAESLGADFIGLIFASQSPRCVDTQTALNITKELTSAKPVGVFVEHSFEETHRIAEQIGLWGIQHYSYFEDVFEGFKYIFASRLGAPDTPTDFSSLSNDYLLLDTYDKTKHGGTGQTFDWSRIPKSVDKSRLVLAGGLAPENICAAARENSFALDLSSSVEAHPGKKDPQKLKQLFDNLRDYRT